MVAGDNSGCGSLGLVCLGVFQVFKEPKEIQAGQQDRNLRNDHRAASSTYYGRCHNVKVGVSVKEVKKGIGSVRMPYGFFFLYLRTLVQGT
jgi:hypothetical protein